MGHEDDALTPDEAYKLVPFQRPGVKYVVGPTDAYEAQMDPISSYQAQMLTGPSSFWEYNVRRVAGFTPHALAQGVGAAVSNLRGTELAKEEWVHLHAATSEERNRYFIAEMEKVREAGENDGRALVYNFEERPYTFQPTETSAPPKNTHFGGALAELQGSYRLAAQPIVARIAEIERAKPIVVMVRLDDMDAHVRE